LRLGLIPADDAKLRAAAIADFIADERDNDTPGGPPDPGAFTKRRKGLSEIGAQTPGGIAWKIATALDFWKDEETWGWWRYRFSPRSSMPRSSSAVEPPKRLSPSPIDRPRRRAHACAVEDLYHHSAPPSPAGLFLFSSQRYPLRRSGGEGLQ
jgi:hypothetical protein